MLIRIKQLDIENFKSLKKMSIDFNERKNVISGRNESGKTTVADAFFWLMFGKDSHFRTKFEVKPLDRAGNHIHNLKTMVRAIMIIDGHEVDFARELEEDWTVKHGEIEAKLSGNTTSYYIDEVPVKKSEFDLEINKIISEDDFKLLTSNTYFNEQLDWKKRRKILTSLIDDITYETIVNEKRGFSAIKQDITENGIERTESKYKHQAKKLRDLTESIPARIDEVSKNINSLNKDKKIEELQDLRTLFNRRINELKREENFIDKNFLAKKDELQKSLDKVNEEIQATNQQTNKVMSLESQLKSSQIAEQNSLRNLKNLESERVWIERNISDMDKEKAKFKERWIALKDSFFPREMSVCSTCNQDLPADMLEQARENFDTKKKGGLSKLVGMAKSINLQLNVKKVNLLENTDLIEKAKNSIIEWNKKSEQFIIEIEDFRREKRDDSYFLQKQKEIKAEMYNLAPKTVDNSEKINENQEQIDNINTQLANYENSEKARIRLKQLERELQTTNQNLLKVLQKLDLLLKLKITYIETVEKDINNLFDNNLSLKMFEKQINGGSKETCEIMVKSKSGSLVPYRDTNTAGRINAGLQVINSLSSHKKIFAPVFIDNTESVGVLFPIFSQTIELKMVKTQNELKVN